MKTKIKPPKKLKTRITKITMAALYGLGRYEHVRYELSAEVGEGESATAAFQEVRYILAMLKPVCRPDCARSLEEASKLTPEERNNYQNEHLVEWAEEMGAYHLKLSRKAEAIKMLDTLGGNRQFRDAKQDWENQDDTPF
jgi:hypothetical protein